MENKLQASVNVNKVLDNPKPLSAFVNTDKMIPEKTIKAAEKEADSGTGRVGAMKWIFSK